MFESRQDASVQENNQQDCDDNHYTYCCNPWNRVPLLHTKLRLRHYPSISLILKSGHKSKKIVNKILVCD